MKIVNYLGWLMGCMSLAACGGSSPDTLQYWLENGKVTELSFSELTIEPLLGWPNGLKLLGNTLAMTDHVDGKTLLLYNVEDSAFVRTLSVGQGPEEILPPVDIDLSAADSLLYVLQRRSGECRSYRLEDLWKDSVVCHEKVQLGNADRFAVRGDGFACLGMYEEGVVSLSGKDGSAEGYIAPYSLSFQPDPFESYRLLQGRLAFNAQSRCLLYAPSYASEIQFYKEAGGSWAKQGSFAVGDGTIEERMKGGTDYSLRKDDRVLCLAACATRGGFYVLYGGERMDKQLPVKDHYILRFNADGTFRQLYKVDPTVRDLCVDAGDTVAYVLAMGADGESVIGKADL